MPVTLNKKVLANYGHFLAINTVNEPLKTFPKPSYELAAVCCIINLKACPKSTLPWDVGWSLHKKKDSIVNACSCKKITVVFGLKKVRSLFFRST